MKHIVYLIPLRGVGGVEVAAQSLEGLDCSSFKFSLRSIFKRKVEVFSIYKILKSIKDTLALNPDILIVSLWRAVSVGIIAKIFRPKLKIILFIHSEKDTHFFDFIITRIMLIFAQEVWCDSITSAKNRFKFLAGKLNIHIISFNSRSIERIDSIKNTPNFIYWGRISKDKGLYRALEIFESVLSFYPNATYTIIGSFDYDFQEIRKYCSDKDLLKSVVFYNEMDFNDIQELAKLSSYYLQTSKYEGLSMSVMESMMLGLVPVVTPVGAIGNYCNYKNSIIVHSNMESVRNIIMTLRDNEVFRRLSNSAVSSWDGQISYRESIIENFKRLVNNKE